MPMGLPANFLAGKHFALGGADGGFHFHFFSGQVAGHFIDHQHADFFQQLAEILGAGIFVAHQTNLMLNQRMIKNVYLTHEKSLLQVIMKKSFYSAVKPPVSSIL